MSLERLSEASDLSVASVQRRLKRLKDSGTIERQVAVLNPEALGQNMTFIVTVEMERDNLHHLDAFQRCCHSEKRVQQCYYATGTADFTLICVARDMADFENLTHKLFFANNNVRRFNTAIVMGHAKRGLSVPIDMAA